MRGLMQNDLFDVAEIETINVELKKQEHQRKNEEAQKLLELPYFSDPKNDNELLLNYQYEFIKNKSSEAWGKLILLSFEVTKRIIWKWMKEKKLQMDEIEQDEKCSIAVEYVLRRYKKNIGYCIKTNFISALKNGVKHAIQYKTKLEMNTSYIEDEKTIKRGEIRDD